MTVSDRINGPVPHEGFAPIRLSAVEMAALVERFATTALPCDGDYYVHDVFPVRFWVPRREWEAHKLRALLHACESKWKDVLTEPTLVKLRALLNPPAPEQPEREGR